MTAGFTTARGGAAQGLDGDGGVLRSTGAGKRKPPAEAGGGVLFGLDEGGGGNGENCVSIVGFGIGERKGLRILIAEKVGISKDDSRRSSLRKTKKYMNDFPRTIRVENEAFSLLVKSGF